MGDRSSSRADFSAYVVARWPHLVAAVQSEGVGAEAAERVVARALATCRSGWGRLVRDGDVDVEVWRLVREEAGLAPAPGAVVPLDGAVEPRDPLSAASLPDPVAVVHEEVRRRRARGARVAGAVVAALLVGAGVASWWASRPPSPEVVEATNPVPVPWYADGRLHLAEVVVTLPGVRALASRGSDVLVLRGDGDWWQVDPDGDVDRLGERPPGASSAPPAPTGPPAVSGAPGAPGLVLGDTDRVVDGTTAPDGTVVHVLDNSLAGSPHGSYVRLSGSGRVALVVCRDDGRSCGEPVTAATGGRRVLLR
jgi:hypothetical protein